MKKLLLLGGSMYLMPAIEAAHHLGVYVVTCDYLPDNYAHRYSDEYRNVSIIDHNGVLTLAKELHIDGIMSYATDPGVECAAWVAEQLGLPTNPYKSVSILQNKGKFRNFLKKHGFNVPWSKVYRVKRQALMEGNGFVYPVMVKPTDSAGSKGVTKVEDVMELDSAIDAALSHSIENAFIVEQYLEKAGNSTDSESFSINGELVFCSLNDQMFDLKAGNPYVPAAYIWPSSLSDRVCKELRSELQRLLRLLRMETSIYNVEARLAVDGKAYLMEVAPRAGGNRLAEVLKLATGQDLSMAAVKAALGMPIEKITNPVYNGHWGEVILHSDKAGKFLGLSMSDEIKPYIHECRLIVKVGDMVRDFQGANEMIGSLILRCNSKEQIKEFIGQIDEYIHVNIEE